MKGLFVVAKEYVIDNPNLIKEWHFEKNDELGFYPDKITCGSNKKVWWKCSKCNYEWQATPNNRSHGTNCPVCANRVVVKGKNDLATTYPEIAKRWHPILNKLKASEITAHSNKKVYWTCEKDKRHYFLTRVDHMVEAKLACPVCVNQSIIIGVNDLATTHPKLINDWDFEKNDELGLDPKKLTYGSNKKVWWKCEKGHSWKAAISSRAGQQGCGCPECAKELRVSFAEDAIGYYLSKCFNVEKSKHFNWLGRRELDIYLPDFSLGIEYDGAEWHKVITRDREKDLLCYDNKVKLIRIREPKCPRYETSAKLLFLSKKNSLNQIIGDIFIYIKEHFRCERNTSINIERDYDEILKLHISQEKEKCIRDSVLIKEWDYDKNSPLIPSMFKPSAHKKVWWKCALGHSWKAAIYSRTGKEKCGCPYCTGQKVVSGWNDLQTLYPQIADEWDYEQNENIFPNKVRPQSNKKYGWICSQCSFHWFASVAHRVNGRGCPRCGREKTRQSRQRKVLNIDTNKEYESSIKAAEILGINASSIRNCCNGKTRSAGGYHWKYISD